MTKYVYDFSEGNKEMKALLGGKGANLAEMTSMGLPVPHGFTISTEACLSYLAAGGFPAGLMDEVEAHLSRLEASMGKRLGDATDPLLVSVRSGAKFSMPGMMDTVLNLGLNEDSLAGLAKAAGDLRFARDAYRRFIQMFGKIVMGVPGDAYEHALDAAKARKGPKAQDTDLDADDLKTISEQFLQYVKDHAGREFPDDPYEQLLIRGSVTEVRPDDDLAAIDEFGKLIKVSRARGNTNGEAALDKLVEAFGRVDGVLRPPSYSTMTLSKSQAAAVAQQEIHNPAITVLGASTPATFYESLPEDLVQDGFVNRLLVVESHLPMQPMRLRGRADGSTVPPRIVSWVKAVHAPPGRVGNLADLDVPNMPANAIGLPFDEACIDMLEAYNVQIAAKRARLALDRPVLTSPDSAVRKLKELLG